MISLNKIENLEQLRAEKARLLILQDQKEALITTQVSDFNDRLKPVFKILRLLSPSGKKEGEANTTSEESPMGSLLKTGLSGLIPMLISTLIAKGTKTNPFVGALAGLAAETVTKNAKNVDMHKIGRFLKVLAFGKDKPKDGFDFGQDSVDWESEIYNDD
ncbi:hypothetical protein SAMN06265350_10323 [Solitalea koreensis]|uniref:Uncharacterized protein n=2 Tax=Solitalea koreensis TaxID=543615 RepID=A0A521BXY5_9SPHI|nr:hypothetical protein SAMN06265350_10323 [Solitalea koreensis]